MLFNTRLAFFTFIATTLVAASNYYPPGSPSHLIVRQTNDDDSGDHTNCIISCSTDPEVLAASPCGMFDIDCFCTNEDFQKAASKCIETKCGEGAIEQAEEIREAGCGTGDQPSTT